MLEKAKLKSLRNKKKNINDDYDLDDTEIEDFQDKGLEENSKPKNVKQKKNFISLKVLFTLMLLTFIYGAVSFSNGSVVTNSGYSSADIIKTGMLDKGDVGKILFKSDTDINFQAQTQKTLTLHEANAIEFKIWDFAGEDGDYVQVFFNNVPLSNAFRLSHEPESFIIPAVAGEIRVRGIKDGEGGGISYAIHFPKKIDDEKYNTYYSNIKPGDNDSYIIIPAK